MEPFYRYVYDLLMKEGTTKRQNSRAREIVSYAEKSVGLTDGTDVGRKAVRWYAEQILKLDGQPASVESILHRKCREIPYAENILAINGVGENILSGILE